MAGSSSLTALGRQLGIVQTSATKTQQALATMQKGLVAGGTLAAVGVGIGAGMLKAANETAKLAMNLKAVQLAGRYTNTEMQGLTKTAFDVSNLTAQSAQTIAASMATVAASTGYTKSQLQSIMPVIGRFADVMAFGMGSRGVPFDQSVLFAARFAGMFHLTDVKGMAEMMRELSAVYRSMPGTLPEVLTQLRQFSPIASALGVSPSQQLTFTAFLNRMGMTGRAGTGLAQILVGSMPSPNLLTATAIREHIGALAQLGMVGPGGALVGSFDQDVLSQRNPTAQARARADWMQAVNKAFGITGERIAVALAGFPDALKVLKDIEARIASEPSIIDQQTVLMATWAQQWSRMMTNAQNVVFRTFLPGVSGGGPGTLSKIGTTLGNWADWITPDRAANIVRALTSLAGFFAVGGTTVMVSSVVKAMASLGPVGLAGSIVALTIAAIPAATALGNIIAKLLGLQGNGSGSVAAPGVSIPGAKSPSAQRLAWAAFLRAHPNIPITHDIATHLNAGQKMVPGLGGGWQWTPLSPPLAPAPLTKPNPRQSLGGAPVTAYITINQQPGEDTESMLNRLMHRLDQKFRDAAHASGAGVHHPMIAPRPGLA